MLLASYSAQARPCGKNRLIQPQTPIGPRTPEFEKAGEEKGQYTFRREGVLQLSAMQ